MAQQPQTRDHADDREQRWERAREPVRVFQSDSPADFKKAGEEGTAKPYRTSTACGRVVAPDAGEPSQSLLPGAAKPE